ncbi:MAG: hypothetical protein ACREFZ_04825 [Acetobacteraceae bacterium]
MKPDFNADREILSRLIETMVGLANAYGRAARMADHPETLARLEDTSVQCWNSAADLHAELARLGEAPRACAAVAALPRLPRAIQNRNFDRAAAEERIRRAFETALGARRLSPHVLFAIVQVYSRFKACLVPERGESRSVELLEQREPDAGAAV